MTNFLIRHLIKNSENTADPAVRQKYGELAGLIGIMCNVLLFVAKFVAGMITSSVSISADAFNNLSDAGSSIVTLIGFRLAGRPADLDHPFGHGRIEYLSGLIVSVAILLMGYEILRSSITKIIHPSSVEFSYISTIILICSIALKLWMSVFNSKIGNTINSSAMKATAADSRSDCIATTTVLAALVVSVITGYNIDGFAGLIVSGFVLMAGINSTKDVLRPILGQPADKEFVDSVIDVVLAHDEIVGVHDLVVHDYGPGRVFVTMHAEVPYEIDVMEAHDVIDLTEKEVADTFGCEITIHMDPIIMNDTAVTTLREMTQEIIERIDPVIKMHDFRITDGPAVKNLIFDIVVPFGYIRNDDEIVDMIKEEIKSRDERYFAVIHVDKCYVAE